MKSFLATKSASRFLGFVFLGFVAGLSSCANLSSKPKMGLKSFVSSSPFMVRDLGAVALSPDWSGDLYQEKRTTNREDQFQDQYWSGRGVIGSPAQSYIAPIFLENNRVLAGGVGTGLAAYDFATGKALWTVEVSRGLGADPFILTPYVYASFLDATVKKIDINSGEVLWSKKIEVESTGGVFVHHGFVYVTFADNSIWALDEKTGSPVWTYKRPASAGTVIWSLRGASTPKMSSDGTKILAGFADGSFVAISPVTGEVIWEKTVDQKSELFKDLDLGPIMSRDGKIAYIGQVDGDMLAVEVSSGRVIWRRLLRVAFAPYVDEKMHQIWVSSTQGKMYKIAMDTGNILTTLDFSSKGLLSRITPFNEKYMVATWTKVAWSLHDRQTGEMLWEDSTKINSLAPVATEADRIALISTRNKLHLFSVKDMTVKETLLKESPAKVQK